MEDSFLFFEWAPERAQQDIVIQSFMQARILECRRSFKRDYYRMCMADMQCMITMPCVFYSGAWTQREDRGKMANTGDVKVE